MEAIELELSSEAMHRLKSKVRKKNQAFRRVVQEKKEARRNAVLKLRLASMAAVLAWAAAGAQLLR